MFGLAMSELSRDFQVWKRVSVCYHCEKIGHAYLACFRTINFLRIFLLGWWQQDSKCQEQNSDLYRQTFVDMSKAFDTVSGEGLWRVCYGDVWVSKKVYSHHTLIS